MSSAPVSPGGTNTTPDSAARKREIYKQAFKKYDADDSNSIDAAELGSLLHDLGWKVGDDDVSEALTVLDKDGNGNIDLDEFLKWSDYAWHKFILRSSPTRGSPATRRYQPRGGAPPHMESLGEMPE